MSAPLLAHVAHLAALAPELDRVLAAGLARLAGRGAWPAYELDQSLLDLLRLSHHEDACYDRPSTGWAYGAWYHGRRTHDAVRLLAPALAGRTGTVTIADLGAGTGATLWALTALVAAARRASVPLPGLRLVAMDASEPMLVAAEVLWDELRRSPVLGEAARTVDVRLELASWTDLPSLRLPGADARWLVGGYLFDESDRGRASTLGDLLSDTAIAVDADEIHLVGNGGKTAIAADVGRRLDALGWQVGEAPTPGPVLQGPLAAVATQRAAVYGDLPRYRALPRPPGWTRVGDAPRFLRCRDQAPSGQLFQPPHHGTFLLDEDQHRASRPDGKLTAVIGAAGSGKSRVLVERVIRTVEQWPRSQGAVKVLLTTFNVAMVDQLAEWLAAALPGTTLRHWRRIGDRGAHHFADPAEPEAMSIAVLNWDKVPARVFRVAANPGKLGKAAIERGLRSGGVDPGALSEAQRRVVHPEFVDAELRRVIYGLRTWHDREAYLAVDRRGRRTPIGQPQRELVWQAAFGSGVRTWTHYRIDALVAARAEAAAGRTPRFTHVFLDECQDMTPADFELVSLLVGDPDRVVVAGDEAQSLHLGRAYQRPGLLEIPASARVPGGPAHRRWRVHRLAGSYRLPIRVCECVRPLAERLDEDRRDLDGDHDVGVPEAMKPAVLGIRPIVVSAANAAAVLPQVFAAYRRTLDAEPAGSREITIAESSFPAEIVERAAPPGYRVTSRSMLQIKGLERPCIIWSTSGRLRSHEFELEWTYTIITRTRCLAIFVVDPAATPAERKTALCLLRDDRLLCWDAAAEAALRSARD